MRGAAILLAAAAALTAGCLRATAFRCERDAECGAAGACEATGYCSVANGQCAGTGRAYSDTAGPDLANTCVPGGAPQPDAGVDGAVDGRMAGCPPGYAAVNGSSHLYKAIPGALSWTEARTICGSATAVTYLAQPDDATELAGLAMVAAPPFWVGLDDNAIEGMFVNRNNVAATFLPWAAGEPDNGPPEENCVDAVSSSQIATERCGARHPAICECEP